MRKLIAAAGLAVLAGCSTEAANDWHGLRADVDGLRADVEELSENVHILEAADWQIPETETTVLPPPTTTPEMPDLLGMTLIEAQRAAGVVGYSICYEVGEYETDGMAAVGLVVHQYLDLADPECGITVDLEQSEGAVLIDEVNLPPGLYRITPDGMIQEVQEP